MYDESPLERGTNPKEGGGGVGATSWAEMAIHPDSVPVAFAEIDSPGVKVMTPEGSLAASAEGLRASLAEVREGAEDGLLRTDLADVCDEGFEVEFGCSPLVDAEAEALMEVKIAAGESEEVEVVSEALAVVSADEVLDRTVALPPATPLAAHFEAEADKDAVPVTLPLAAGLPFPPPAFGPPMIIKGLPTPPGLITVPGSPLRTTPSPLIFKLSFPER